MKKAIVIILALVGLFALVAMAALAGVGLLAAFSTERVPRHIVLEVDFEQGVIESIPDDPLAQVMLEGSLTLRDVVDALDRAAEDRRVEAVFARIGSGGIGLAQLQEIRDAVMRFRESGKPAYAFAETFGEFGPGNGGYYLATAFDHIYLQPSGDVGLTGMIYESPFVRGLLNKLHVTPQLDQRMEYKNAMNFYTDQAYNEPFQRAMQALLDSQFGQLVRGIAEARDLPEPDVVALIDRGPFLGQEAVAAGLVDELVYRDEAVDRIEEAVGDDAEFYDLARYLAAAGRKHRKGTTIALIEAYGAVVRGSSRYSPLDGSVSMGADTISSAFRSAIEDRRVKAIIFRVDSPGGSYVASDTIWRETIRAQEADKPVIVSMGNLAGSGGYFVAMNADKIVAQPGTITASIGVLGGKLLTRDFWKEMVGVTWDDVSSGGNSRMWTGTYEYGPSYERFAASLDRVYEDFTGRVAAGRDLPHEEVLELARGRIWTGEDALELGLVDELGGVDVALRLAREAIGLEPDAPVRIKRFPRRRSTWELFVSKRSGRASLVALQRSLAILQPKISMLQQLGLWNDPGPLTMPRVTHTAAPALR
jgi:protease-4